MNYLLNLFPFLIGKVLTFEKMGSSGCSDMFPFLIGKVLTIVKGKSEVEKADFVSIPYR